MRMGGGLALGLLAGSLLILFLQGTRDEGHGLLLVDRLLDPLVLEVVRRIPPRELRLLSLPSLLSVKVLLRERKNTQGANG